MQTVDSVGKSDYIHAVRWVVNLFQVTAKELIKYQQSVDKVGPRQHGHLT